MIYFSISSSVPNLAEKSAFFLAICYKPTQITLQASNSMGLMKSGEWIAILRQGIKGECYRQM